MDALVDQVVSNYNPSERADPGTGSASRPGETAVGYTDPPGATGGTGGTNTGTTNTGTTNTGTTNTGTTSDTGGDNVQCLLSKPVQTAPENTCWAQCQQAERDRQRQCDDLFRDIEDALAARGCPARVVATPAGSATGANNCCYPPTQGPTATTQATTGCSTGVCSITR